MPIIRRGDNPEERFTIVSNAVLRDSRISFRARGILTYLLSHKDGWHVTSASIAEAGAEGREAVRSAMRELQSAGYLEIQKHQDDRGRWRTDLILHTAPITEGGISVLGTTSDNGESSQVAPKTEKVKSGNPPPIRRLEKKTNKTSSVATAPSQREPSDGHPPTATTGDAKRKRDGGTGESPWPGDAATDATLAAGSAADLAASRRPTEWADIEDALRGDDGLPPLQLDHQDLTTAPQRRPGGLSHPPTGVSTPEHASAALRATQRTEGYSEPG